MNTLASRQIRTLLNDAAGLDDVPALGEFQRRSRILFHQKNRYALFVQQSDNLKYARRNQWRKSKRGFVKKK